jgi:hypothetical protein
MVWKNASKEFTKDQVKKLIDEKPWEFLFIGADIDSYSEARRIGIPEYRSANFRKSSAGVGALFDSVSRFKIRYENDEQDRGGDWKKDLD